MMFSLMRTVSSDDVTRTVSSDDVLVDEDGR